MSSYPLSLLIAVQPYAIETVALCSGSAFAAVTDFTVVGLSSYSFGLPLLCCAVLTAPDLCISVRCMMLANFILLHSRRSL